MERSSQIILSICIPTYNRKELLLANIKSILVYEKKDIEVVVCDNASSDGTWEALAQIRDSRLRIYRNEENRGAEYNYGKVLREGKGKYLVLLNDRDRLDMQQLEDVLFRLKQVDIDVVVTQPCTNKKSAFTTYEMRAYWHFRLNHPGTLCYSYKLIQLVKNEVKQEGDEGKIEDALWALSSRKSSWRCLCERPLIIQPKEELSQIKPERESSYGSAFFMPNEAAAFCIFYLKNCKVSENEYEAYIRGIYRGGIWHFLYHYRQAHHSKMICERYGVTMPKRILWIKEAVKFQERVFTFLEEQEICTIQRKIDFSIITLQEYLKFKWNILYKILMSAKKKMFPKPWFKNRVG